MGTDNRFHLKKEQKKGALARQAAKRSPYESVLIVCEGKETEVNYFTGLINFHRLNSANIEVLHSKKGSAPISIVNYAIELAKQRDHLDRVVCVFDYDDNNTFKQAIKKLKDQNVKRKKPIFMAAISIPCFEFWLLLHFKYTTKQYSSTQNRTTGENLIVDLKQCFPEYVKNMPNLFSQIEHNLPVALQNANKLRQENIRLNTSNPSTNVDEVVKYLIQLTDKNYRIDRSERTQSRKNHEA